MEPVQLQTQRIVLSPPTAADVDAISEACQDVDIQRWVAGLPSPYEHEHAVGFVEHVAEAWKADSEYTWAIRIDGLLIGMIGLHVRTAGAAELGFWLSATARRQGLLTEAATAVIDWGFVADGLALERIEWRAGVGNIASAHTARALGFQYEGLLRQAARFGDERRDCWIAGLLATDDRSPRTWAVLGK